MKILLDTNAYSAMRIGDPAILSLLRRADEVLLSAVVLGELLHGFDQGRRRAENRAALERLLDRPYVRILPVTRATAERYARIATAQRRKGRPIPSNDMWIAAHALETGADLVSYDDHFGAVDGLVWVKPGDPDAGAP